MHDPRNRTHTTLATALWLALIVATASPTGSKAHNQEVHEAIAQSAALSSEGFSRFLNDVGASRDTPLLFHPAEFAVDAAYPPIFWLTNGAFHEDDDPRWADHFYTLAANRVAGAVPGLTDWHETIFLPGRVANSYRWATKAGLAGPCLFPYGCIPENAEKWGDARDYEYAALTSPNPSDRDANMAHMFYALGHVLHLNQDLSQPEHVRNDTHFFNRCIERFGSGTYLKEPNAFPLVSRGWAYWQSEGFSSLLDFWDRNFYQGTPPRWMPTSGATRAPSWVWRSSAVETSSGSTASTRNATIRATCIIFCSRP